MKEASGSDNALWVQVVFLSEFGEGELVLMAGDPAVQC